MEKAASDLAVQQSSVLDRVQESVAFSIAASVLRPDRIFDSGGSSGVQLSHRLLGSPRLSEWRNGSCVKSEAGFAAVVLYYHAR